MTDLQVNVRRGEMVESVHRVSAVVCDAQGRVQDSFGRGAELATYWRSAAKPIQALPIVTSGAADHFDVSPEELALFCASHSGEPRHTEGVVRVLERLRLDAQVLACGAHPPYSAEAASALAERQEAPTPVHNNCSGKHAGMVLLARRLGVDPAGYTDPAHPVQEHIFRAISQLTDVPLDKLAIGVDGCGVPVFGLPMTAMATAYARLAARTSSRSVPADLSAALKRISKAMRTHPEMVAGEGRLDTDLMRAFGDRMVSKAGAEGIHCLGVVDRGWGIALKVEDGARRAMGPALTAILERLGLLPREVRPAVAEWAWPVLRNHRGDEVGRLEPEWVSM